MLRSLRRATTIPTVRYSWAISGRLGAVEERQPDHEVLGFHANGPVGSHGEDEIDGVPHHPRVDRGALLKGEPEQRGDAGGDLGLERIAAPEPVADLCR